jgi:hypothetical protein
MKIYQQQTLETKWNIIESNIAPDCLRSIKFDSIEFSGRPNRMKGKVLISNSENETIWVQELKFEHPTSIASLGFPTSIQINTCLAPGETKLKTISICLPDTVAKDTYKTILKIGNQNVPVTFIVEDNFNLSIFPKSFLTQGVVPGQDYEFNMEITNSGNIDYIIPKLNHSLMLDTQYECKARSWATMNHAKDGKQAFKDGYYKRVGEKYAFWVKIAIKESGEVIKAGASLKVSVILGLPKEIDINACYSGDIAIVGRQIIKYQILQ